MANRPRPDGSRQSLAPTSIEQAVRKVLPEDEQPALFLYSNDPADIVPVFNHSIFLQCFLPPRSLPRGADRYQADHGRASLLLKAGELLDPTTPRRFEQRQVPAGAKARLLFAYINDQAIKTGSPGIDMGSSLRGFMAANDVPVGGKNGREIIQQVKNIAAAQISFGFWEDDHARQENHRIAHSVDFWLEKDERQRTLWQPTLTLGAEYFETLREHRVPLNFRSLVALQSRPRMMDVYAWLVYRLPRVRTACTKIRYASLQEVFSSPRRQLRDFRRDFRAWVAEIVLEHYPEARIDLSHDEYVTLYPSRPLVPTDFFPRR
jgi:hypothetical protein